MNDSIEPAGGPWAWLLWLVMIGAGGFCMAIFLYGAWTYHGLGDARVRMTPTSVMDWGEASFRVFRDGDYDLHVETVNHEPPFGAQFRGTLELRVLDADGRSQFQHILGPRIEALERPDNYDSMHVATIRLSGDVWRAWRFQARVAEPDPSFAGVRMVARIDRVHPDFGLAGVGVMFMIAPAAILWMVSVFPAMRIRDKNGSAWPLRVSVLLILGNLFSMFMATL